MLLALGGPAAPSAQQLDRRLPPAPLDTLEVRARVDSNDAVVHYELALGYWKAKRWDDADRALQAAVSLAPQYAEAYLALSVLPRARGEKYWRKVEKSQGKEAVVETFRTAERYYRRAFLVNPMVDLSILGRTDESSVVWQGSVGVEIWWLGPLKKGLNQFVDGNYERAYGYFDAVLSDPRADRRNGKLPDGFLWYRALAAAHLQRYDQAIEDLAVLTGLAVAQEQADTLGAVPLRANDYRYTLATVLYLAGRYDQAAPTFRRALEFDIALFPAHVQLARISESRQDWEEAVRERQAAIDANPDDPGLVTDLGTTLLRAGKLEEASEAFARAMGAAPRDARIPYLAGIVALRLGRPDAAREALARFVSMAPSRFGPQIAESREQLRLLDATH